MFNTLFHFVLLGGRFQTIWGVSGVNRSRFQYDRGGLVRHVFDILLADAASIQESSVTMFFIWNMGGLLTYHAGGMGRGCRTRILFLKSAMRQPSAIGAPELVNRAWRNVRKHLHQSGTAPNLLEARIKSNACENPNARHQLATWKIRVLGSEWGLELHFEGQFIVLSIP